ncbi:MAG: YutD family protein [Tepidibacillus sp.]
MIHMFGHTFELVVNHKDGWNAEAFRDRYSEVLDKYDYIVGDWGYNQLRLKGFYGENPRVPHEMKIESFEEYLFEYCNFGCAHFILKKTKNGEHEQKESKK